MDTIKKWLITQKQQQNADDDCMEKSDDTMMGQPVIKKKKHWKLRKRRRVMRYSEKLSKEYKEKQMQKNIKSNENENGNEREQFVKELEQMTALLKKGVVNLRETLKQDNKRMNDLDEETHGTLDKVSALNHRLTNYVESTSGMTCTMCLMMATVAITWIWCFTLIYFI